jgi:hypothetical protein
MSGPFLHNKQADVRTCVRKLKHTYEAFAQCTANPKEVSNFGPESTADFDRPGNMRYSAV